MPGFNPSVEGQPDLAQSGNGIDTSPSVGLLSDADLGISPAAATFPSASYPPPSEAADNEMAAFINGLPGGAPGAQGSAPDDGDYRPLTVYAHPRAQIQAAPSPSGSAGDDLSDFYAALATQGSGHFLSDADVGIVPPVVPAMGTGQDVAESGLSGLVRGVASAPFAVANLAKSGADAIVQGGDWLTRKALGLGPASQATLDAQAAARAHADTSFGIPSPSTLSKNVQGALTPYLHTPQTGAGQVAQTVGEFAPFVANAPNAVSSVGNAVKSLGVGAVAPALGSEWAGSATKDTPLEPYARVAGALLGGVGAAGAGSLADRAGQIAQPMIAKGAAVMGRPGMQEGMAANAIVKGASDPAAMRDYLTNPQPAPDVAPGFKPTLYQATGDQGIGQMERVDKTANSNAPYLDRAAEQNQANSAAVRGLTPDADVMAPVAQVQGQLDRLDQITQGNIDAIKSDAQSRASQIGTGAGPEAVGSDLRGQLSKADAAHRASEDRLWKAVDPDRTLTNSTAPIAAANKEVYGNLSKADQGFLSPAEQKISEIVSGYKPIEPFQEVAALRSNLASEMRKELAANGKTPAYRRMALLMGGVQKTINRAAEGKIALDNELVARGEMAPELSLQSRLKDLQGFQHAEPVGGYATGTDGAFFPAKRVGPPSSGMQDTAPPAMQGRPPQSLVAFLRANGGIKDMSGELAARDLARQFPGLVNNKTGSGLDAAREAAAEAGYLGGDTAGAVGNTDVNDLLRAIDNHPTYSVHDEDRVAGRDTRQDYVATKAASRTTVNAIRQSLKADGYDASSVPQEIMQDAANLVRTKGLSHREALDTASENAYLGKQEAAARAKFEASQGQSYRASSFGDAGERSGSAGRAPSASSDVRPYVDDFRGRGAGESGTPTFDEAAATRARIAADKTRQNRQTYGKGPVGDVLRTAGTADSFRLADSMVPAKVFPAGAKGYEAVQSYLKAAGNGADQLEPLKNAALESLRAKIASGGILNQKILDDWRSPAKYGHALRAIDEASPGFSKQFDSTAKVSDALDQAVAARKETMKAYQSGLVGKMIGAKSEDEVVKHFSNLLGAPDRVSQMQTVLRATKGNPEAVAGVKKALGDALAKRFMTQTEAGTSGEKMMSANAFKKIYSDAAPVLSQVYSPEEMDTMRKVANGFDLASRSVNNKVAGSPGTASDLFQGVKSVAHKSGEAGAMLAVIEGLRAGYEHGGVHGAAMVGSAAGAAYVLKAIRSAGIHDVQHLVSDALQNPDRARLYARNLTSEKDGVSTGQLLQRSFLATPLVASNQPHQQTLQRASGGRVEEPTDGQKEAGNYKKDHVRFAGLDIAIENRKGAERSGVDKDGKRWSVRMPADYGYIKRTVGADGDHVDCYLGPDESAGTVFVIDQKDLASGRFDEHKCMIGFKNREAALGTYQKGFSDGKGVTRIMKVTPMSLDDFSTWLRDGDTKKPIIERASGGRVLTKERVPLAGARKAPDGKWYVPDLKRPGKYNRIDFHASSTDNTEAASQRRTQITESQKHAFGLLVNAAYPHEAGNMLGALLRQSDGLAIMSKLSASVAKDQNASAGLRRALVAHITEHEIGDEARATHIDCMVRSSMPALRVALGPASAAMLGRISALLPNAMRQVDQQKGTADLNRYLQAALKAHETVLERLLKLSLAPQHATGREGSVFADGGPASQIIGSKAINAIRATGARTIADLIADAVLNPEQYAALLSMAPVKPDTGSAATLAAQLRRSSLVPADAGATQRAAGGGVGPFGVPNMITGTGVGKKGPMPFAAGGNVDDTSASDRLWATYLRMTKSND